MRERKEIGITGSRGFIGNELVNRLHLDFNVQRLDRFGYVPPSLELVYDLAAYGNMSDQKDVMQIYQSNLMRVMNTLMSMPKTENRSFVFVSTSSVGLPTQTFYSASKRAAEDFVRLWSQQNGIKSAIVRPFSVTGVGEQSVHLIPRLIDSCINGTKMPFVPEPRHDYIDVQDLVEALWMIGMSLDKDTPIYEVGSGISYSNQEVLEIVEDVTGKKAKVYEVESLRNYDTQEWVADPSAMIEKFNWSPSKDLRQSIKEMVDYARKNP